MTATGGTPFRHRWGSLTAVDQCCRGAGRSDRGSQRAGSNCKLGAAHAGVHLCLREPHQHPRAVGAGLADQQSGGGPEVSALDGCGSGNSIFHPRRLSGGAGAAGCRRGFAIATFLGGLPSHAALRRSPGVGFWTRRDDYASLLARVQAMEQELHEKELAEERTRKLAAETRLRLL